MIGLIGSKGNMGKRYKSILEYLEIPHNCYDIGDKIGINDGYIVATPTDTHCEVIKKIAHHGNPILCEKPVSKDPSELREILEACRIHGTPIEMVNQYNFMGVDIDPGESYYNYFKHGTDGLLWDCINIIGMSSGSCKLLETSPIWECTINDHVLNIANMDNAYIDMIKDWFSNPLDGTEYIKLAHKKVWELSWN